MKCEKCHSIISKNDKFCSSCGSKIKLKNNTETQVVKNNTRPLYILIAIMGGIIILLTIIVYILIFNTSRDDTNCITDRYIYNNPYDI